MAYNKIRRNKRTKPRRRRTNSVLATAGRIDSNLTTATNGFVKTIKPLRTSSIQHIRLRCAIFISKNADKQYAVYFHYESSSEGDFRIVVAQPNDKFSYTAFSLSYKQLFMAALSRIHRSGELDPTALSKLIWWKDGLATFTKVTLYLPNTKPEGKAINSASIVHYPSKNEASGSEIAQIDSVNAGGSEIPYTSLTFPVKHWQQLDTLDDQDGRFVIAIGSDEIPIQEFVHTKIGLFDYTIGYDFQVFHANLNKAAADKGQNIVQAQLPDAKVMKNLYSFRNMKL